MADDALSAAELEALLGRRAFSASASTPNSSPVTILPFGRTAPQLDDRLTRQLSEIHERFAKELSANLSTQLRRTARIRFLSVRETTGGAFLDRLKQPTCVSLLTAAPWPGHWWLEIEAMVLYPMIDSLLGGGREASPPVRRPPTEIELRLAARLANTAARALQLAWQDFAPLSLSVERATGDTAGIPLADRSLPLAWLTFEATVGAAQGSVHLALPLGRTASTLGARREASDGFDHGVDPQRATIELVAHLPELEISDSEATDLSVGDIIETEHPTTAPIEVTKDGLAHYRARLGSLAGHKALEIEPLEPESE